MAENSVVCRRCRRPIAGGRNPAGRPLKCPHCGHGLGASAAAPAAAGRPQGTRQRTTPLMRKVLGARPSGGVLGTRPGRRSAAADLRPGARRGGGMNKTVLLVVAGLIAAAVLVFVLSGKPPPASPDKTPPQTPAPPASRR